VLTTDNVIIRGYEHRFYNYKVGDSIFYMIGIDTDGQVMGETGIIKAYYRITSKLTKIKN